MDLLEKWQKEAGATPGIRAAFEAADGLSAQDVARASRIAESLGTTPDMVLADPRGAEREGIARFVEKKPLLAKWATLKNGNNAPFVYEDAKGLAGALDAVSAIGVARSALKTVAKLPAQAAESVYNIAGLGLGALDYMEAITARGLDFIGVTKGQRTGWAGMARDWALANAESIRKNYLNSDLLRLPAELRGRLWDNPGYLLSPEYLSYQLGDALNSVTLMLAGGYGYGLARGGALASGSMAKIGSVVGGLMEGSSLYDDLIKEGVGNERALSGSISFGAVVGLLEKAGLDKILEGPGGKGLTRAIARRFLAGGAEAATEYAEEPAQAILAGLSRGDASDKILSDFFDSLTNVDVLPGSFLLGGGMRHISEHTQKARASQEYAQDLTRIFDAVEATGTKQLSPERMQSALEYAGEAMRESVALPADAMLELYQEGTDLLTPLGFTEEQARRTAALGQDFLVPVAKLPAYLNRQEFEAAARIMRRTPEALNAAEAAQLDARLEADAQKIVELYQDNAQVFDQLAAEKERLRGEAAQAIRDVPGLLSQVEALAGGVDSYVDTWLNTVERFALRMGATGQNPVEIFQRMTLDSLRAARRENMTQEERINEDLADLAGEAPAAASGSTATGRETSPGAPTPAAPPSNGPLVHTGVETLDDLYRLAREAQPSFQTFISGIGQATGGEAHFRPGDGLKRPERVQRKIEADYPQEGAKRVLDVLGATLLYEDRAAVEAALPAITREIESLGGEVARIKNRFEKPSAGYKDYLLNIRMPNGMVTELLLTTRAMSEAKAGPGHDLYEAGQALASLAEDASLSDEQRSIARIIRRHLRKASKSYYDSTGEGSNETASASVIEDPLNMASVLLEELSSTSVYPKLVSLLGSIRQVLPSVASTNGMSSYSRNSSTNTVPPSGKSSTRIGIANSAENPAFSSAERARSGGEGREEGISESPLGEESITHTERQNNLPGKVIGSETTLLGKGTSEQARYEVWELDDVIPSHDPENGFARREDYPAVAQERPYHSDAGEQEKVRGNARAYQPAFVVNSDPTAGNGPPIITSDGIVLGGNSRAMTLQLVYADRPDSAAAYRQALTDQAAGFGLDPAGIEGMRRPILVRVVEGRMTPEEMSVKSRLYNQTTTQKLQAKAEGVSRGRMISAESLAALSEGLAEFDTLRQFMDSPRSKGFVGLLLQDGVIEQTEVSSLTEKNGRLNDSGKKLVEDALRGMVVADYDVLEALPASVLNKLDRAIPALARLKARGEGWDMSHALTAALRMVGKATAEGRKVEGWLGQVDLLDTDPDKKRPAVQALALTFANATQKELAARFETMAAESERQTKGQGLLVAQPENKPGPAFIRAFLQPLAFVDGKAITGFDPQSNSRHAALQWAYEHGGKGHSVAAAMERLHKNMTAKKATAAQKAEAQDMMQALADFSGAVNLYPPKLGPYFSYREGQELFQTAPATDSTAFKKWFGKSKVLDDRGAPLVVYHGTGATVGDDFGFDYKFLGKNGSAEGYGFYFTSDVNTAQGYQEKGGSLVKAYLSLQKPMPMKQKPFSKAVLKKILKRTVEKEIEQFPDETPDYRDSFLSNYADTYGMSFDRALNEAVNMIYDADTALEQISEIANASGNKRGTVDAVRDVTGYDGVFANGYGDNGQEGGKIYVAWFPEQVKSIQNKGTWDSADPRILYQPVYHGTPHRFDGFSLDAIGTGEGQQAHGWGLYFAKDRNVSENYRKFLTNSKEKYVLGGKEYTVDESNLYDIWYDDRGNEISKYEPVSYALRTYSDNNKDVSAAIEEIKETIEILKKDASTSTEVEEKALKLLEGGIQKKVPGQLFEADIPENDVLLDEQKTLEEQPEKVQSALRALVEKHGLRLKNEYPTIEATESGKTFWIKHPGGWEPAGAPRFRSRAKAEQWLRNNPDAFVVIQNGKRIYNQLVDALGSPRAASLALNDLGVKGIAYDGAQDGRCFVVFDDKAINILQTYYQNQGDVRGSVRIYPEGYLINLFKGADLSTLLHETGHIFFEEMERMVQAGAADETMRRDYEAMRAWLGAEPGQSLTEEMREQAARGFEAYLMEGKAPSVELESVFARFKKWLLTIYQSATRLNAPLTDEVRGVFDRMLSTEREIAATAARNELLDLTARELDALRMTGTARTTAAGLPSKGREAAAQSLQKSRDANRKARLEKYAREARDEVRAMPVYRARGDLRRTPLDLEAVREGFGEDTARSLLTSLPGSARKDGGVDPEIFAAEHGYESAAAMFADVLNAKRQGDAIAEVVRQKEARHDAEYDAFEHLMETREVSILMELVGRKLADVLGVAHLAREAYQRAARQELAAMPLGRAVQTGYFLAAMRRALRQAHTALAAGDMKTALAAHRKVMLNMEFVRLSRELARRRDSVEGQIKRFIGMKKGDPDARYMVMNIGMRHGLVKFSAQLAEGRDARTVQTWMQAAEEDGYTIFADDRILYGAGQPWREMSVADFESLMETVAQIVTVERNRRQVRVAGKKAELDACAQEIANSVLAANKEKSSCFMEEDKKFFDGMKNRFSLFKMEVLFMRLDGKEDGPLWQVYKMVSDAEDKRSLRLMKEKENLNRLYGIYTTKERAALMREKFIIKSLEETISRENMLALALNMGNATNHQRLLESRLPNGKAITEENIAEILSHMTEQDCAFVNAVWEYLESFREESFALEERMTGLRPQAVEARPFILSLADGRQVAMRGGYYPIAYDAGKGTTAHDLKEQDLKHDLFGTGYGGSAQTRQGHLKQRRAHGLGSSLKFKLGVIDAHVYNIVNDLAMREPCMDAARILRHKTVRNAIERVAGTDTYLAIMPWLRDVVRERPFEGNFIDSAFHWMRNGLSYMAMGFKVGTALLQASGLFVSISRIGLKYMARGLRETYQGTMHVNPFEAGRRLMASYQEVAAKSPFMTTRLKSWQREVKDASRMMTSGRGIRGWLQEHAFDLISIAQLGVDLPTWNGAYLQGLDRYNGDEAKAVAHADRVVRLTQGSGRTADLAAIQRGGELQKTVTTFYSWFNTMLNLAVLTKSEVQHAATKKEAVQKAAAFLFWAWFGTQAMEIVLDGLRGRGPEDDDDEKEWAKYLGGKFAGFWAGMIPLGRDIFDARLNGRGLEFMKGARAVNELASLPGKLLDMAQGKKDAGKKAAVGVVRAAGYATNTPTEPAAQILKTVWDYMDGTTPELEVRKLVLR